MASILNYILNDFLDHMVFTSSLFFFVFCTVAREDDVRCQRETRFLTFSVLVSLTCYSYIRLSFFLFSPLNITTAA